MNTCEGQSCENTYVNAQPGSYSQIFVIKHPIQCIFFFFKHLKVCKAIHLEAEYMTKDNLRYYGKRHFFNKVNVLAFSPVCFA